LPRQVETVAEKLVTGSFFKQVSQSSSQPMSLVYGIEHERRTRRLLCYVLVIREDL